MWNDGGVRLNHSGHHPRKKACSGRIEKFDQGILLPEHVKPLLACKIRFATAFWGDIRRDEGYYNKGIEVLSTPFN